MTNGVSRFQVNTDSVDCGIKRLGWCRGAWCQKFANLTAFLIVLSIFGLLQGACETYFRISTKQAALASGYDPIITEWLLVSSGLFQVAFAFIFAHWAHHYHPISWLGGITMLEAVSCLIVISPSISNLSESANRTAVRPLDDALCSKIQPTNFERSQMSSVQSETLTIILLYVLQLGIGLGSLAFFTIALPYIDDNSESIDSAATIAIAMGSRILGVLLGTAISLGLGANYSTSWIGWAIFAPLLLVSGILLGLFPRHLTKTVIRQAAKRMIDESTTTMGGDGRGVTSYIDDIAYGATLKRLFRNKLLLCNVLGIAIAQTALVNYLLQEENYLQSRFLMPVSEVDGLMQEWQVRFVSYFLKPPIAAVSMLLGGLTISKLKLSARVITGINIALGVLLFFIYIAYVFIKCEVGPIAGIENSGKLVQPYCSRQCICSPATFLPVCPENSTVTFFSPCYAGCNRHASINGIQFYEECSCGNDDFESRSWTDRKATEGACNRVHCAKMWFLFQVLSLLGAAIYGLTAIGKIIISLRSVLPQDKAMALAMEVTFVCFLALVPGKLLYDLVSDKTCIFWTLEYSKCLLRANPKHGNILNLISAALILIGIVFDVCVFVFVEGLNIYDCNIIDLNYTSLPYAPIQSYTNDVPTSQSQTPAASPRPMSTFRSIFRSSSSVTNSSAAGVVAIQGVTYAQIAIPSGSNNSRTRREKPKMPHLSASEVQNQRTKLKSTSNGDSENSAAAVESSDEIRSQSPETNL